MPPEPTLSNKERHMLAGLFVASALVLVAILVWPTKSVVLASIWKDGYRVEVVGHPYNFFRDGLDYWSSMDYAIIDHDTSQILCGGYLAGSIKPIDKYKFGLLSLSDTRYLCLVESSAPDSIIMIYDTRTGERWPGSGADDPETVDQKQSRAALLLAAVQARSRAALTLASQDQRAFQSGWVCPFP